MENNILYKYLDADGGLKMLQNSNLQFSNATKFNDPFDCHPSLIDCSKVPAYISEKFRSEIISNFHSRFFRRARANAWICCLSKVYDALLMWSYYTNHKGICIGLNIPKTKECFSKSCRLSKKMEEIEVQYMDIIHKPDYFQDKINFYHYQLGTKSKAWEHEQEVRLCIREHCGGLQARHCNINLSHIHLDGECFVTIYLGVRIEEDSKNKIIDVAYRLNPDIEIYQMVVDENAFRLTPKIIE